MAGLPEALAAKERRYFGWLEDAAEGAVGATDLLDELLHSYPAHRELAEEIATRRARTLAPLDRIREALSESFVTPFDRDDVVALAAELREVVNRAEQVAAYLEIYKRDSALAEAKRLAQLLLAAARTLQGAIAKLRRMGDVSSDVEEIGELRREAVRVGREGLSSLFVDGLDPLSVVAWKDLLARLGGAVDATDHAANILAGVVLKHG
jgi:uncharacterized protein Yka (UPF0111/DUF47 family)